MPALYYYYPNRSSHLYSLKLQLGRDFTHLTMQLFIDSVNTRDIPQTFSILQKRFPSVLKTECFNEDNIPFFEEVRHTEIGHLFEHILLEYLCILKIAKGHEVATYQGKTAWNWKIDPRGTFHIYVDAGLNDMNLLHEALEMTTVLFDAILDTIPEHAVLPRLTRNYSTLLPRL